MAEALQAVIARFKLPEDMRKQASAPQHKKTDLQPVKVIAGANGNGNGHLKEPLRIR
jgi:hypothetical protein